MEKITRAQITDGLDAKRMAFSILNHIFIKKRGLDEAFKIEEKAISELSPADKVFVKRSVFLVLKHKNEIDLVMQRFLFEAASDLKPNTLINILRLGVAQFAYMKTAAYAAVNTTLDLIEAEGIAHQKNLVSSLMRRVTVEGFPDIELEDSAKVNTPEWMWNEWVKDWGEEIAKQIARTNFNEVPLDLSVRREADKWAKTLGGKLLSTYSIRKNNNTEIIFNEDFFENDYWAQNAAAALPVLFMGDLRDKQVIDLCAAPGGKTAQMASVHADVIAVERSANRLKQLQDNMMTLGLEVQTVVADGTVWKPDRLADVLLIDAPSSATGMLRHRPDLLHIVDKKDQEKNVALQRNLLSNSVNMLKPGGVLVYCNCSLQKDEGERQFDWVLNSDLPLKPYPIRADELDGISEMVTMRGEFRSFPYNWEDIGGIDGFYIARFIKQ